MAQSYTSERLERRKFEKRIERTLAILSTVGTILAILFFIACLGYVGNNDLEMELINQGYTPAEAKELMR